MTKQFQAAVAEAFAALGVITHDPRIRGFLLNNDSKALQQCAKAFADLEREMALFDEVNP